MRGAARLPNNLEFLNLLQSDQLQANFYRKQTKINVESHW